MTLKNVLGIRKENFHFRCTGDRKVQMKVKNAAHPSGDSTFINSSEGFLCFSFQNHSFILITLEGMGGKTHTETILSFADSFE
jgi:hypothetical protein